MDRCVRVEKGSAARTAFDTEAWRTGKPEKKLTRRTGPLFAAVLVLASATASGQTMGRREAAPPADAASVESAVAAFYASVSHAPEASPNFERMRSIFLYVGMIVPPKSAGEKFTVSDVDSLADRYEKSAARKAATGLIEREIARRTDCFGNVCQVFSTYESRFTQADAKPFERGVHSMQLLRDGRRWWIASVAWDVERPDNPIPAQYLPGATKP
ncbi:MAG: hypothetical protein ABJC07_02840 [Acidobacteriota bacterium]